MDPTCGVFRGMCGIAVAAVLGVLLIGGAPVASHASSVGFEITPYAGFATFDNKLQIKDGATVGGRLGLYVPTADTRLLTGLACGSALALLLVAYRWSLWRISIDAPPPTAVSTVAWIMFLSVASGAGVATVSSWSVLTSVCAAAVLANIVAVTSTAARMLRVRVRLAGYSSVPDAAFSKGGTG